MSDDFDFEDEGAQDCFENCSQKRGAATHPHAKNQREILNPVSPRRQKRCTARGKPMAKPR